MIGTRVETTTVKYPKVTLERKQNNFLMSFWKEA